MYAGYDRKTRELRYVGISSDVPRREHEHGKYQLEKITPLPVTRLQARAIEQALIVKIGMSKAGGILDNRRNEISESRDFYCDAIDWGGSMLDFLGFP